MFLPILLVAAIAFALLAWFVPEPTVKKVSVVLFAICAITLVVVLVLNAAGVNLSLYPPR